MRGFIAPVMDKEAFMGSHRRKLALQPGKALLVHLISFFTQNRGEKGDKNNDARRNMLNGY
jgi:hypothetical protein